MFKGIVNPEMKICWKYTHHQAIQDEMSLFLQQNRFGEILHYITCSPMDPMQWMGAVRMRIQTADKNIIHK